jgi:hypothetical protein
MVLIGLLLMLGCAALATDAVIQNGSIVHAVVFNQHVDGLSLGAIFVVGCVVGLVFATALAWFVGGLARSAARRRERRALLADTGEAEVLRERNARLENELATRDSSAYPAEPATTTSTTDADTGAIAGRHRVD